jgi:hypothetical protein
LRRVGTNLKAVGEEVVRQSSGTYITSLLSKNYFGEFVIAGADNSKTYILTVGEGHVTPQDEPGFVAVGSGCLLAYSALAAWGSHKGQSVEQGVCLAYEAKKLAESVHGVGKKTDMGIVDVGVEARLFDNATIEGLEKIYLARRDLKNSDKNTIRRLIGA